jgi:uncharacterized protein YuzE
MTGPDAEAAVKRAGRCIHFDYGASICDVSAVAAALPCFDCPHRPVSPDTAAAEPPDHSVYLYVNRGEVAKTEDVDFGITLDWGKDGTLVGIEVLNVQRVTIDGETASPVPAAVPPATTAEPPTEDLVEFITRTMLNHDDWCRTKIGMQPYTRDDDRNPSWRSAKQAREIEGRHLAEALAGLAGSAVPAVPPDRTAALLRLCAEGRREYASGPETSYREDLLHEATVLDMAARVAENDRDTLRSLLPSWRWTDADRIRSGTAKLTVVPPDTPPDLHCLIHEYLSTACWHEVHDECRRTCKFCDKPCACDCHAARSVSSGDDTTEGEK